MPVKLARPLGWVSLNPSLTVPKPCPFVTEMLWQVAAVAHRVRNAVPRVDGLPKLSLYELGTPVCAITQFMKNGLAATVTGDAVATLPSPLFDRR